MEQLGSTVKQEQPSESELETDLEEIFGLGSIIGDIVPSSSTPLSSRSQSTISFSTRNLDEPSPITHDHQQPTPLPPGRALFQVTSSQSISSSPGNESTRSTPTKQPTLQQFWSKRRPGTVEEDDASSTASTVYIRTRPGSTPTAKNDKSVRGKTAKKRGKADSSKNPSPSKKRKSNNNKDVPVAALRGQRNAAPTLSRTNDSGIGGDIDPTYEETSDSLLSTSSDEYNDEDEPGSIRDTVPHFSIHRLPVDQLRSRFENDSLTETEIIDQIMDEVNEDTKRRYKDRGAFEIRTTEDSNTESETRDEQRFGFRVVVYIQKVEYKNCLLTKLGIHDKGVDLNVIIFYYRKDDIYAVTVGQTWQAVQPYSCYDFPCHLSGRLTRPEGNVEETIKLLAGNVRTSKATKKNATLLDQLKNVRLNVIKEMRGDSSLFRLKEFNTTGDQRPRTKQNVSGLFKMQMGLAYVRIKKRMDIKNLPEILDHFSKICRGDDTFTFPANRVEKHIDEFPSIRVVPKEEAQEVENSFYELIQKFMHNQHTNLIRKFDFVDKHVDDFCNAEEFKLIYNNGGEKCYDIATFPSYPTALQVLQSIRTQCGDDIAKNGLSLKTFSNLLRKNVKLMYKVRGQSEYTERRVVDLLEGEMSIDDKDFWKTMGRWWYVREEYYYKIYKEFRDLLNKPGIYGPNEFLKKPWDMMKIKSVQKYVQLYEGEEFMHYFPPPTQGEIEEMSSQASNNLEMDEEGDGVNNSNLTLPKENHFFDMMRVCKEEDGNYAFWLFYIFDGFDAGIRDASTRITKSVEMLLKAPTTSTRSLLEKFWEYHSRRSNYFSALFHDFDMFRQPLTEGGQVSIVVAFATGARQSEISTGPLSQYLTATMEHNTFTPSLDREKCLRLNFNLDNVWGILRSIQDSKPECLNVICAELQIAPPGDLENYDAELLTTKVLGQLMAHNYCTKDESAGADKPVTGKLLKIRDHTRFKLFRNENVNKTMFEKLQEYYISGFPGFLHKLECFQIYENVSKEPRLNLNFVEIK